MTTPRSRAELEAPYRHPTRYAVGKAWRENGALRGLSAIAVLCALGGAIGMAAGVELLVLTVAVGALIAGYVAVGLSTVTGRELVTLRRDWGRRTELGDVLAARPHAGSEDPELVHDRFAVTAQDDGWLLTWRFRPLALDERPGVDEVEVPGRPRHAAKAVEDRAFDHRDAAVAAEQLVAAQDRAAARETAAADAAARAAGRSDLDAHALEEARSTAAALQRATGQRSRRD